MCKSSAEICRKMRAIVQSKPTGATFHTNSSICVDLSFIKGHADTPTDVAATLPCTATIHDLWFNLPTTFKQQQAILKLLLKAVASLEHTSTIERASKRRKMAA